MKILMILLLSSLFTAALSAKSVAQQAGSMVKFGPDNKYEGYLVRPTGKGPFPGIVVIHEWWGLNDTIKSEAGRLAKEGYAALAVDLFGKSTTDPQEAMRMTRNLDQKQATAELIAAADYLRSLPCVPDNKVGSLGWCFGGAQSLQLALNDPKLAAAVIYYGSPVTDPAELKKIKAAVLGIFGDADQSIPLATVKEFDAALTKAGVRHEIYTYPRAGHAFANPTRSDSYRPSAAKDAWGKTLTFLTKYLKS